MTEDKLIKNTEDDTRDIEVIEIEGYKICTYEVEYIERIKGLYGFIYVTTNLINGKMYVGQKVVSHSWKTYLGSGKHLLRAIKKYGKENFERKIIDIAFNANELNNLEYYYTIKFKSVTNGNWYNIIYGGGVDGLNINNKRTRPVSNYMVNGNLINNYPSIANASRKTGQCKNSILNCCNGKQYTTEDGTTWRYFGDSFNKFILFPTEIFTTPVLCYDKLQNFLDEYSSTHEAERITGTDHSSIKRCCDGKVISANGHVWCYKGNLPVFDYDKMLATPINQYSLDGTYIASYNDIQTASKKTLIKDYSIRSCCKKNQKAAGGFKWYYVNDPEQPNKSKILYSNNKE